MLLQQTHSLSTIKMSCHNYSFFKRQNIENGETERKMSRQNTINKFENAIMVENLSKYLSSDEQKKIEDMFYSSNIDIAFRETGPKASLFEAMSILFNEPITKMIMAGLLTSSVYDAIKFLVLCFLDKLKNIFIIRLGSKDEVIKREVSHLDLRFKTGNAEVNVLISNNFTHEQNLEYMDKAIEKMIELGKTQIPILQTYEIYVIDRDDDKPELLKVMTMVQYAKEQREKKQK